MYTHIHLKGLANTLIQGLNFTKKNLSKPLKKASLTIAADKEFKDKQKGPKFKMGQKGQKFYNEY